MLKLLLKDYPTFFFPSGVEFAAELRDFVNSEISKLYPKIKDKIRVTLISGYRGVLSTYDQEVGGIKF